MAAPSSSFRRLRHARRAVQILTLCQTGKLERPIMVLMYGTSYWQEIVDFRRWRVTE
jgi:predicted Rossmann-fold nucleotide-binding protein